MGHKGDGSICALYPRELLGYQYLKLRASYYPSHCFAAGPSRSQAHGRPWFLIPIPQKFCASWSIFTRAQIEPSPLCPSPSFGSLFCMHLLVLKIDCSIFTPLLELINLNYNEKKLCFINDGPAVYAGVRTGDSCVQPG